MIVWVKMRMLLLVLIAFTLMLPMIVHAASNGVIKVTQVYTYSLNGEITENTYYELKSVIDQLPPGSVLVIYMKTPGGLLDAALNIVSLFETSSVVTVGFVYPTGSYAWSGGTLVLLSTTVAAMAPGTVIGSCQPVEINEVTGQEIFITEPKILNAVAKYFVEAAEFRGRNTTFAASCVYNDTNLGPEEALKYHVINYVASSIDQLLSVMNGTVVNVNGVNYTLVMENPVVTQLTPPISYQLYDALQSSVMENIISILGVLLILAGLLTAHVYLAGIGAVLLVVLALLGLPINYAGLGLMVVGALLMAFEWHSGGKLHGVLIAVGAVLIAVGLTLLIPNVSPPQYALKYNPTTLRVILYSEIAGIGGLSAWIVMLIAKAIRAKPISTVMYYPTAGLIGVATEDIKTGQMGIVKIRGEYWKAIALEDIKEGDRVTVVSYEGNIIKVRKAT
ncbi:MAG: NfeD family protein [Caldivirga sp.]|uniref:NfeD family protein n=1 Tax=Caldivirga sp. TaxID=2080243 RepID=UPI003D12E42A